jgi:S1-C subfamily serine protease
MDFRVVRSLLWCLVVFLIWLLVNFLFSVPASAQSWLEASVKITNRVGKVISAGSGTIVGSNGEVGLVVTVKHLFRDGAGEIIVQRTDGHGYRGKVWSVDECADLAAIAIADTGDLPQIMIAIGQPRQAIFIGFGAGFRAESGHFRNVSNEGDVFYTFLPTSGDSGGGVFTASGSLAGVVWGEDGQGGAVVGAARLCHFLSHPDNLWAFVGPDEETDEDIPPVVEIFSAR